MFSLVPLLFIFCTPSIAASCWRNTPCTGPTEAAFTGPWDANIYSPSSRTVSPTSFFNLNDTSNVQKYPSKGEATSITGNASALVFDFGKEVGGLISVDYSTTGHGGRLGAAFTEAKNWIGLASDSSNGPFAHGIGDLACGDGGIYDIFTSSGTYTYTPALKHQRGGFRYLTLFLLTHGNTELTIDSVSVEISYAPTWSDLQAYQGYFHSSDDELNKIWYAGAYTLLTNSVPSDSGRCWNPPQTSGWANNDTLSNGTVAIVDGSKRDRTVWPGDMGIAVPSTFYSIGDLEPVLNALQSLYDHQASNGELPFAGLPVLATGSDTYHSWTMIGVYNYVLYTNDTDFLQQNWPGYQKAMEFIYGQVDQSLGLLNTSAYSADWGRLWSEGYNTEANMILYKTLTTGAELATWMGDASLSNTYISRANSLAKNIKKHLYDPSYGAFLNNNTQTNKIYPQDANSMALSFGLYQNDTSMTSKISERLTKNWTPIGAETPELPENISPFISSFEIQAHFEVNNANRALDLIRRSWGWYLKNENGTQSTLIEGYLTNGSFGYRNYDGYDYDSSYTSHAHGWSTGPTAALTNYIVGLTITDRVGSSWNLAPQFGDLTSAQGGFTTTLGKFQASWKIKDGGKKYSIKFTAPSGTTGNLILAPAPSGGQGKVVVNDKQQGTVDANRPFRMSIEGGGTHRVQVG